MNNIFLAIHLHKCLSIRKVLYLSTVDSCQSLPSPFSAPLRYFVPDSYQRSVCQVIVWYGMYMWYVYVGSDPVSDSRTVRNESRAGSSITGPTGALRGLWQQAVYRCSWLSPVDFLAPT